MVVYKIDRMGGGSKNHSIGQTLIVEKVVMYKIDKE